MDGKELGIRFVESIAAHDLEGIRKILKPEVNFRALVPKRYQEATGPDAVDGVIDIVTGWFFEEGDDLQELLDINVTSLPFFDRYGLSYRFRIRSPESAQEFRAAGIADIPDDVDWIVKQDGYYEVRDGLISKMYLACSGWMPAA